MILLEHCSRGGGKNLLPQKHLEGSWPRFVAKKDLNSEPEHEWSGSSGCGLEMCFSPPKRFELSCKIKASSILGLEIQLGN